MGSESAYPKHPRLAVGAIVFKEDKVLLVERGRPPAKGQCISNINIKFAPFSQLRNHQEATMPAPATKDILKEAFWNDNQFWPF
jgi:hypothetical protein